ncbi:caspase activity and apoptosis inhibitor 1 isoform X4 [Monodelphis domestica]|nr:caspase activity and apoptosis inhibitor 1 isoform X4 [Monodelphis domestica]
MKCPLPSMEREKEKELEEPSDIEEGGLDLTVSLKPVSFYIADKKEMLQQCFYVIGEKKLQKMLPDVLKNCSIEEIKKLCQDQLELLSEKKLLKILEGENGIDSDTEEEADDGSKMGSESVSQYSCSPCGQDIFFSEALPGFVVGSLSSSGFSPWASLKPSHKMGQYSYFLKEWQDNSVDSTSSLRENKQPEGLELKQGKGEDSDVLSINADAYDSDIEGPCNEEAAVPDVPENVKSEAGQIDDLQKDIEKSVNEILGLAESSPKESKAAALTVPPSEDVQPSAQQLELLELEMRARAIKALMKAGDVKKIA